MKVLLVFLAIALTLFGMNCNPPADFYVVGGKKIAFDGYSQNFEKLRVIIQSGVNKSSSKKLEKSFTVGHVVENELPINVANVTLNAKDKEFEGKILSTVFSDTSKFQPNHAGTMRIEWNFDESTETLFSDGFSITFKTKLDGKNEDATMRFELVGK
jgi:ribosomal protein L24